MAASARRQLREDMLSADVGISGANFLIADTGAVCTVTNEGNAELSLVPPRVHIVTAASRSWCPRCATRRTCCASSPARRPVRR
jgi:L-lactate dehydrogenase complex protein LldF